MILKNDFAKGKWFHYKVEGVTKRIYINGYSELSVEEITVLEQLKTSAIDNKLSNVLNNGKNFFKKTKTRGIKPSVTILKDLSNLIINGDFLTLDVKKAWNYGEAEYKIYDYNSPIDGVNNIGIKFNQAENNGSYKSQKINIENGENYTLTGYMKGHISSKGTITTHVVIFDLVNNNTIDTCSCTTDDSWFYFTKNFSANCNFVEIRLLSQDDQNRYAYFSNLKLSKNN